MLSINKLVSILQISLSFHCLLSNANLTRSSGLVYYPEPESSDSNSLPFAADGNFNNNGPIRSRIRIALTRNISNLNNAYKMSAPEISYFGAIAVGSNKNMFNVVFDTGSSETWLPYYTWSPFANNLHYSDGFSCKDSTTCNALRREFVFDYRNTKLSGETYEDVFTIYEDMQKDDAILLVAPSLSFRHNFLAIEEAGDEQFRYKPYDGVIGLAPVTQSGAGTRNPLLSIQQELLRRMGSLQANPSVAPNQMFDHSHYRQPNSQGELMFSFWFNPNQNSRHGGELMMGGVDENRFSGDIYFHRVSSWFDWQLPISAVMLGGQIVSCQYGCTVTLDTGANSLVGPREDVQQIYADLQAQYDRDSNLSLVDCNRIDQYPILTFKIEEAPYTLSPRHYIKMFRFRDNVVCYLAIKSWDNQGWLFGTSFIGAYYTVFDFANRRVGFATSRG